MPDDARFWNRIAAKYAKQPVGDETAYRRKLEATRALLHGDDAVLELGCGTGTTALRHAPHAGHIRATDISAEMIRIAREKARAAGVENVDFEVSSIEELDAPEASFDMIMAHSILHLVEDRDAVIGKAARLLKPGGHLVSSTVCMADSFGFMRPVLPLMRLIGKAPRVRFFTREALRESHRRAGLDIIEDWAPGPRAALFLIARKPGGH